MYVYISKICNHFGIFLLIIYLEVIYIDYKLNKTREFLYNLYDVTQAAKTKLIITDNKYLYVQEWNNHYSSLSMPCFT